jgi:hypothetical protein
VRKRTRTRMGNICTTPKRMHPDQRGRAMDAGLGLWRGVGMKTGRLIGVVMPRLVRILQLLVHGLNGNSGLMEISSVVKGIQSKVKLSLTCKCAQCAYRSNRANPYWRRAIPIARRSNIQTPQL